MNTNSSFLTGNSFTNTNDGQGLRAHAGGTCASRPQAASAPLGNTTIFADTQNPKNSYDLTTYDEKTGEIFNYSFDKSGSLVASYDADAALAERWLMLHTARNVLSSPISSYKKEDLWHERGKTYLTEYTSLTHTVSYTDLSDLKVKKLLSHEIGLPVVKKSRNYYEGNFFTDLSSKLTTNTAYTNNAPHFRTVLCCRRRIPKTDLELWQSPDKENFSFHNFIVCGSVWSCPVCSTKINFYRQQQISAAYNALHAVGGSSYMYTLTVSHKREMKLDDLLTMFKDALRIFGMSYNYKAFTKNVSFIGSIQATEVTFGENGWHPHVHGLYFLRTSLSKRDFNNALDKLFKSWRAACKQAGFKKLPSKLHGFDLRIALSADEYLTKFSKTRNWGPEKELASTHSKKSRSGLTPMQILQKLCFSQDNKEKIYLKNLFLEFSFAFKGKHQLQFSRKILKFLEENAVDVSASDDLLASKLESDFDHFMTFSDHDFRLIVQNNLQSHIITLAKNGGVSAVRTLLNGVATRPYFAALIKKRSVSGPLLSYEDFEDFDLSLEI